MQLQRAQAWLGTLVTIHVDTDHSEPMAHAAITAAFDEIRQVHALMSIHEAASDVTRLNREAASRTTPVDGRTAEVLRFALRLSRDSDGIFDISVGGAMVAAGLLPAPADTIAPDGRASYRDIQLTDDGVRFAKPLWIDLGGIAKGYAADRAIAVLRQRGIGQAQVNAGGDIATLGDGPHRIALDTGGMSTDQLAVIEIGEGAVASSSNRMAVRSRNQQTGGIHLDGRGHAPLPAQHSVSVLAPCCMHADALTKPVMALGHASAALLAGYGASAYLHDEATGWQRIETP